MKLRRLGLCFLVSLGTSAAAPAGEKIPGPLFDGLGDLHHPVTTEAPQAQRYFNQGLRLLFGFNHKEAIRSFRSAAHFDPACAMAHWGIAYAAGPHVNKPMDEKDTATAWAALQEATRHASAASPKEQAYIRALQRRYVRENNSDRLGLDQAFANAMRELIQQHPDDLDAQAIFAESLMNTMPWDYWTRDRTPKPETEEILSALKFVMSRNPNHPGANHFYIHAVEAGPNPEAGIPAADRLLNYAPAAGHLVHMPAHIYVRVGQYRDATIASERAVAADKKYIRQCRALGFYPGAYYPHNIHFLWWTLVAEGRSADALRTARQAAEYAIDNYCGPSKAVEAPRLRHLPWITLARFGRWQEALAIPQPPSTNDFLVDRALWHFARGQAAAALKDLASAESHRKNLADLAAGDAAKKLDSPMFPVGRTLAIASQWLDGKAAGARGEPKKMIDHLARAVSLEDSMPYMEPSYWPFPVRPALGAAYLANGDAVAAEKVFREDLQRWPRNGWGLFGLEQALRAQGKQQQADDVRRQLDEAWRHADRPLDLAWY